MKLDKKTKILDLLETNPDLIDLLVTLSPEFTKLKNPLLRKTLGRFATLEHAAQTSGVPFEELSRKIAEAMIHSPGGAKDQTTPATREEKSQRMEALKDIVRGLHKGIAPETQKARFAEMLKEVSASEIAEMEQSLISEGISEEEIKNLCDVHVQVFAESFEGAEPPQVPAGHPVDTFRRENEALGEVAVGIQSILADTGPSPGDKTRAELTSLFRDLAQIEKHYLRKENQLFPMLEKHGVSGPSKVMWALHDDIRAVLKEILRAVEAGDWTTVSSEGPGLITVIVDMIYKEENILFPMAMETLSQADWGRVFEGSEELGFALIESDPSWQPESGPISETPPPRTGRGQAPLWLSTGGLNPKQLDLILTSLPVDITFVDAQDKVQYYSAQPDRIFPRSPGIIGREVQNCHPPSSVHVVQEILNDFREGKRDAADFWIQMGGKFILIRYFAIRDKEGEYEGCLEVSQDVTDIRALEGEKRLLDG
ncbi:MAG: DUF438 domain-containing protein [bacterium]|nr:DUF438 domain-containing protein [bacterium]MDT8365685.1 DUF438 domain-containing protein [bacterium]